MPGLSEERQRSLSERLDLLEIDVSKLDQGSKRPPEEILHEMDAIQARLDDLEAQEMPAKGEEAQFEFITNVLKKNKSVFLRKMGGVGALRTLRAGEQPEKSHWWWYLDEIQASERKAMITKSLLWITGIAVVLVIAYFAYQRFLAPSPEVQADVTYESNIEDYLTQGNPTSALNEAEKALAVLPDNVTFLVLKGIAQQKLGQTAEGAQTLAQAEKLSSDKETYLLQRALLYIRSGDAKSALSDAQAVIAIDPNSAEGYFYEGLSLQNLGRASDAYQAFDQAQRLADTQGKTALVATIRINMGLLLQNMGIQEPTPTP